MFTWTAAAIKKQSMIIATGHNVIGVLWSIFSPLKSNCFALLLLHDVEVVHGIWLLLTVFRNMCDAHEYANCSVTGEPTENISENISRCCNQFVRKLKYSHEIV